MVGGRVGRGWDEGRGGGWVGGRCGAGRGLGWGKGGFAARVARTTNGRTSLRPSGARAGLCFCLFHTIGPVTTAMRCECFCGGGGVASLGVLLWVNADSYERRLSRRVPVPGWF